MKPVDMIKHMQPARSHRQVQGNWEVTVTPPPASGFSCVSKVMLNQDQFKRYVQWLRSKGGLIQDLLPELSHQVREQLISGVTPAEWNRAFGDDG
jgi:hypothetical protein